MCSDCASDSSASTVYFTRINHFQSMNLTAEASNPSANDVEHRLGWEKLIRYSLLDCDFMMGAGEKIPVYTRPADYKTGASDHAVNMPLSVSGLGVSEPRRCAQLESLFESVSSIFAMLHFRIYTSKVKHYKMKQMYRTKGVIEFLPYFQAGRSQGTHVSAYTREACVSDFYQVFSTNASILESEFRISCEYVLSLRIMSE